MTNFTILLKTEISRLARKEVRAETEPLKQILAQKKAEILDLKRRLAYLEKVTQQPKSDYVNVSKDGTRGSKSEKAQGLRFRADGLVSLRKRLGLTGADMAKLLGVSIQSVYHWESGKTKPRAAQLVLIAQIRKLGKKGAAERLNNEPSA
jgi:DNA-binding transcriptional regulator YiaG